MNTLTIDNLKEIRKLMRKEDGKYLIFISELESILKIQNPEMWRRKPNDDVVVGEVWEQNIGKLKHRTHEHKFTYMYVPEQGTAVKMHGHDEKVHKDRNVKKTKELYIFYVPGTVVEMRFCGKDETHELVNNYGCPVYVISAKVTGRR